MLSATPVTARRSKTSPRKKRIILVDDHDMVRGALVRAINFEPDLLVCGEADTAPRAFDLVRALRPDLALVDLSLPVRGGLELIKDLRSQSFQLPVLVLSMHSEAIYAPRAIAAGAQGYIQKDAGLAKLLEAIRCVLKGQPYLGPQTMKRFALSTIHGRMNAVPHWATLTNRELAVLRLIGNGYRSHQIATELSLSVKTIEDSRASLRQKLNLADAGALVQFAIEWTWAHEAGTWPRCQPLQAPLQIQHAA